MALMIIITVVTTTATTTTRLFGTGEDTLGEFGRLLFKRLAMHSGRLKRQNITSRVYRHVCVIIVGIRVIKCAIIRLAAELHRLRLHYRRLFMMVMVVMIIHRLLSAC